MKGNVKNIVLLVTCVCIVGVGIGSIFMFGFNNGNLLPDVPSNNPGTSHVLIDDGTGMQTEYQNIRILIQLIKLLLLILILTKVHIVQLPLQLVMSIF